MDEGLVPVDTETARTRRASETLLAKTAQTWLGTADDDTLLASAREGNGAALAELYRRHRLDALRYARRLSRRHLGRDAADDILAEAVRKVLTALGGGRGPLTGFRAYLFTAIRTVTLTESRNPTTLTEYGSVPDPVLHEPEHQSDAHMAMRALAQLPERWRRVLWTTKVDEIAPTHAGPMLGMRPNAVAALAMRARSALRIAYVREHLPRPQDRSCRSALDLLARQTVTPIGRRQDVVLRAHLDSCTACAEAGEIVEAHSARWMRAANGAAASSLDDGSLDQRRFGT
jgi:RNA polymerase sigma factor (sigma-70 family)